MSEWRWSAGRDERGSSEGFHDAELLLSRLCPKQVSVRAIGPSDGINAQRTQPG